MGLEFGVRSPESEVVFLFPFSLFPLFAFCLAVSGVPHSPQN